MARPPARRRGGRRRGARGAPLAPLLVASGVGVGVAQAQAGGSCPLGTYQRDPLLFGCATQDSSADVFLSGGRVRVPLPSGLRQFRLTAASGSRPGLALVVRDGGANQTRLAGTATLGKGATPSEEHAPESLGLTANTTDGVQVTVASLGSSEASVEVPGTLRSPLCVDISCSGSEPTVVSVTCQFDGYEACPTSTPSGCATYNASAAQETVRVWSTWVSAKYDDADLAWERLCSAGLVAAASQNVALATDSVPFFLWESIWSRWNASSAHGHSPWQAAFKYVDSLVAEDRLVSKVEFALAYKLSGIAFSLFPFCRTLHQNYLSVSEAWQAVAGDSPRMNDGVGYARWEEIWDNFLPPDNFRKGLANESFAYADPGHSGVVSGADFELIWNSCTARYDPQPTGTRTASTIFAATTGAPPTEQIGCCDRVDAVCLACQAGRSVKDFCEDGALKHVPGCQRGAGSSLTTAAVYEGAGCPYAGYAYGPPLADSVSTWEVSPADCQARCTSTSSCAYFSFWWLDGECVLQGLDATWSPASDAISGPPVCIAAVDVHVLGVDYEALTTSQRAAAGDSFARDLAEVLGLQRSAIRDLQGASGSVSLTPGSLVVGSRVVLPGGYTVANASRAAAGGALQALFAKSVAALNISRGGRAATDVGGIDVSVGLGDECMLPGTRYQRAKTTEGDKQAAAQFMETVKVRGPTQCQLQCAAAERCTHFTYFQDSGLCVTLGGAITHAKDPMAIGGPRSCAAPPPASGFRADGGFTADRGSPLGAFEGALDTFTHELSRDLPLTPEAGAGFYMLYGTLLCGLVVSVGAGVLLFGPGSRRRKSGKPGEAKYRPLSREEDEEEEEEADEENGEAGSYANGHGGPREIFAKHEIPLQPWPTANLPGHTGSLGEALFNVVDRNHDGFITREEWEQAIASSQGAPGGPPGGQPTLPPPGWTPGLR